MAVSFARPNVANLVFHLYGRSVHPELFQVYAESQLWQNSYSAQLQICDAGHVVAFCYGDSTIFEVTATQEQLLPKKKRLLEKRLRGHRDDALRFENGLRYQVSYQLEQLDPDVFVSLHEELLADCNDAEVAHCFPASNRLAPGPVSLLRTEASSHSLLVHAFHTFPENCAVVKTQSLYEL
jgi:hypothetical protein